MYIAVSPTHSSHSNGSVPRDIMTKIDMDSNGKVINKTSSHKPRLSIELPKQSSIKETVKDNIEKNRSDISSELNMNGTVIPGTLRKYGSTGNIFENKPKNSFYKASPKKRNIHRDKSKERLMKDFMAAITNQHCANRENIQKEKEELYKNYENNINLLESWIQQIKSEGFDSNNKMCIEKKKVISELIDKNKLIYERLISIKRGINTFEINTSKVKVQIDKTKDIAEKNIVDRESMINSIAILKKELPFFSPQTEITKEETKLVNENMKFEENEINKLNGQIKQINKKITVVNKEKEGILASLTILQKKTTTLKNKINSSFAKTTTFMLNVHSLVNNPDLFT